MRAMQIIEWGKGPLGKRDYPDPGAPRARGAAAVEAAGALRDTATLQYWDGHFDLGRAADLARVARLAPPLRWGTRSRGEARRSDRRHRQFRVRRQRWSSTRIGAANERYAEG